MQVSRISGRLVVALSFGAIASAVWGAPPPAVSTVRGAPFEFACQDVLDDPGLDHHLELEYVLGAAVLYPEGDHSGVAATARCLFAIVQTRRALKPNWPGSSASNGLLVLMRAEPSIWFSVAVDLPPAQIDVWLDRPIQHSQFQPVGECEKPDKFELTAQLLKVLTFPDAKREELRRRVLHVLESLKCETAQ